MKLHYFMQLNKIIFFYFISLFISFNIYAIKSDQVDVKENNFHGNISANATTTLEDVLNQIDEFNIPTSTDDLTEGTTNKYNPFGTSIDESEINIFNSPTTGYFLKWNGTAFEWAENNGADTLASVTARGATTSSIVGFLGNVGIGTEIPSTNLDVIGNIKASGVVVNGDTITDFTGTGLSITDGVLNVSDGAGSGSVYVNSVEITSPNFIDTTSIDWTVEDSEISGEITESDPDFNAWDKSTGISITESQISDLQSYLTSASTNDIQDIAWDVLESPYAHLAVAYNTTTNKVEFMVDDELMNYDWTGVTDSEIPNTLTIDGDSIISEDAMPGAVIMVDEIDTKAKLETLISESLLGTSDTFSGDVSGAYNATSVDKIKGIDVNITGIENGDLIVYNSATGNFEMVGMAQMNLGLYANTFTDAQLTNGVLTIAHNFNLDEIYKIACKIYNNNNKEVDIDDTTIIDKDTITIDLSTYGTITGTWSFVLIGDGATAVPRSMNIQQSDGSVNAPNITTLKFDQDTGLHIADLGGGIAEISIGSHWYGINVDGQTELIPVGEEDIELEAGDNVTITTDNTSTPKKIRIDAVGAEGGSADRIYELDSSVEVIDTSDGRVELKEDANIVAIVDDKSLIVQDADIANLVVNESATDFSTYVTKSATNHKFSISTELYNSAVVDDFAFSYNGDAVTQFGNILDAYIQFPFSISVVFKPTTYSGNDRIPSSIVRTDPLYGNSPNGGAGFAIGQLADRITVDCGDNTGVLYPYRRWITASGTLPYNTKHHVLAVWRAYNDVDVLIDGVEKSVSAPAYYPGQAIAVAPDDESGGPRIGGSGYYIDAIKRTIIGEIDEVAFFNADKSADISNFYENGAPKRISISEPNLIFLVHMDEGTGYNVTDSVASAVGTHYKHLEGSPYIQTTTATWVAGLNAQAEKSLVRLITTEDKEGGVGTLQIESYDTSNGMYGDIELNGAEVYIKIDGVTKVKIDSTGGVLLYGIKEGISQVAAGSLENEVWADSDDGYTLKLGQ